MNSERRSFFKKAGFAGLGLLHVGSLNVLAKTAKAVCTQAVNRQQLNIMYTNDLLGKVNGNLEGYGGINAVHKTIEDHEVATLVFDAGGFLNSKQTFSGQIETLNSINKINYHAVNLSAADLKQGLAHFEALLPYVNFKLVNCNYQFDSLLMQKAVASYQILKYGKFKVGVTGVGEGLVLKGVKVTDPLLALNKVAKILKEEHQCDYIICLAHLGLDKAENINNKTLAEQSENVNLVIGGNSDLDKSLLWALRNANKAEVYLSNNNQKGRCVAKISQQFNVGLQGAGLAYKKMRPTAGNNFFG